MAGTKNWYFIAKIPMLFRWETYIAGGTCYNWDRNLKLGGYFFFRTIWALVRVKIRRYIFIYISGGWWLFIQEMLSKKVLFIFLKFYFNLRFLFIFFFFVNFIAAGTGYNWNRDLKLGWYFFFIYFEPYEPLSAQKFENAQNKDHPTWHVY